MDGAFRHFIESLQALTATSHLDGQRPCLPALDDNGHSGFNNHVHHQILALVMAHKPWPHPIFNELISLRFNLQTPRVLCALSEPRHAPRPQVNLLIFPRSHLHVGVPVIIPQLPVGVPCFHSR